MKPMKNIAIGAAIACAPPGVPAQQLNTSWYIQPSLNGLRPDADFGAGQTGHGAALRLGKPLAQEWDLQFGASAARSRAGGQRYRQTTLGADALYFFSRQGLRPFLLAGVGAGRDERDSRSQRSPYASVGVGLQAVINARWSFQADLRTVHGFLRGNTFPHDSSNNYYVTLGLNYAFGRKPAVHMAPPLIQAGPGGSAL